MFYFQIHPIRKNVEFKNVLIRNWFSQWFDRCIWILRSLWKLILLMFLRWTKECRSQITISSFASLQNIVWPENKNRLRLKIMMAFADKIQDFDLSMLFKIRQTVFDDVLALNYRSILPHKISTNIEKSQFFEFCIDRYDFNHKTR